MSIGLDLASGYPAAGIPLPRYVDPSNLSPLTARHRALYPPGVPQDIPNDGSSLVAGLHEAVAAYPHRVATDFFGATLTYKQLYEQIAKTTALFKTYGLGPGDRLALILPNCPQFIIAFYAALELGAVVACHNPLAPVNEMQWQLKNHGAKVVVVWEKSVDHVVLDSDFQGRTVFTVNMTAAMPIVKRMALKLPLAKARDLLDQLRGPVPAGCKDFDRELNACKPLSLGPVPDSDPDLPAVLLHTGGTTGSPKAVVLTHRNLVTNVEAAVAWVVNLREGAETWYCVLPFFHAFGLNLTMLSALRMGATLVLFPRFSTDMVLDAMKRRKGTFILGVPPVFQRLTAAAAEANADITSFRYAISGAMPLSEQIAQGWEKITKGYLVEGYGMTETSPIVLGSPFTPQRRPGTLGIVFPSIHIRVVEPEDPTKDVAPGEVGELIVKGPGVTPGYWNDPEETAAAFTQEGWLRTGDLVREDDDFIVMADRRKELIISGGFNIFPSQVEEAIADMPGIEEVAVVGIPDATRGEEVRAVLVLAEGAKLTLAQVRAWVEDKLPRYALPRSISVLRSLPRSQLGKVLRREVRQQVLEQDKTK
ncbi:MAG: AMP-binding protein [Actinomycetaceae bacterium]|nr:AMP-binding protein [Actinomycetaceae bacterium]